jgi:putative transposase
MQRLATRHSRRLNHAHGWSGSVWDGRFHCSPIDTERYLLTCGRYVDQNPVRAKMVATPDAYPWSSYRARAGSVTSPLLDPDPALEALAGTPSRRFEIYRELASAPLPENDLEMIRGASQRNQLTGDEPFVDVVRRENGRYVPTRRRGRPKIRRKVSA